MPAVIVGMGASAGGLEAFKAFFAHTPADSGMAFVLVHHLAPEHKRMLVELLQRETGMPVLEAEDGAEVVSNRVFVIPPNVAMTIEHGRLGIDQPVPARTYRHPIDTFFGSLAEDQGEGAVGIVLSGTDSDGSLGMRAIREHGGLTLAQAESDSRAQTDMPDSAAATGLVDYMLKIEEMPAKLAAYRRHLVTVADRKDSDGTRRDVALRSSEQRYRALFEAAPMAVFVCDRDAVIQAYNRQAVELWGREPRCGVEKHCGSQKLWRQDGTVLPHEQSPIMEVLRTGLPAHHVEVSIERPDGTRVPVLANFAALTDAVGAVTGAITTFVDIRERKRAEEERGRLAAIVESSQDAIILHSLDGIILAWNAAAERIFGYPAAEAIGQPMTMLLPADVDDPLPKQLKAMQCGRPAPARAEVLRLSRSGQAIDLSMLVSPVYDVERRLIAASTVAREIADLREKDAHRDMLLHELSHRVKNTLATVQAIAMQTLSSAPEPEAFKIMFQARLMALSHVHELLMQSNWHGAALRELVGRSLAPYRNDQQPLWTIEGKAIQINPKATLALGMVFHELATNAAKYGALSNPTGHVEVRWRVRRDGTLRLTWAERDGPRVEKPERRGFGSRLIQDGLNYELGADVQLDYAPPGLRCTIDVALEAVIPRG